MRRGSICSTPASSATVTASGGGLRTYAGPASGVGGGVNASSPLPASTGGGGVGDPHARDQQAKTAKAGRPESNEGLVEKQQMVEKLFRHTNKFLEENKDDPLLVVEALAAILVRYTALLGPVEQLKDRLTVMERLIGQESAQIQEIAKSGAAANWSEKGEDS